jgi:hypothetical protein
LTWEPAKGAAAYIVRWRPTDASNWQHSLRVDAKNGLETIEPTAAPAGPRVRQHRAVLKGVRVDDWVFGVSAVSADGYETPVASAVPGGAFRPYTPPAPSPAAR